MKTLLFTGILFFTFCLLHAQVTLNKKYEYSTSIVKLETLGYKYYLMDVPNGQCRLYNTDHSLFKTVNCNVPSGFYLYNITYLSEKIFDTDAGIEMICTYYKYNTAQAYYEYDTKIINDDGSQIQFIDGALYNYINATADNTYKLFSYSYDYSVSPEKVWTNIYNLPALVVSAQYLNENKPEIIINAFPNPASTTLEVEYSLPENINQATLHLIDNMGKQVQEYLVDNHTDHLMLDVSSFQSGVYMYFIEYGNTKTAAKKLIIQ